MKLLLVVATLALAAAAEYVPIMQDYHKEHGIELAARIKAQEEALDFDGSRIAGGSAAAAGAQPHLGGMVITMSTGQQSVCGCSLLSNIRIITAAHCWRHGNSQAVQFTLVFGSALLFSGGTRVNTNTVIVHPNYNQNSLANDVAMAHTAHITFTNLISSIGRPIGTNTFAGTWAVVAGYGRTGDGAQHNISNNQGKRQVSVQVITNAVCQQTFGSSIIASTICVATPGGQGPCPGDSGGPLAIGSGNNRQLIGVVSFGHILGCTRGFPAGFARVTSFNTWINSHM